MLLFFHGYQTLFLWISEGGTYLDYNTWRLGEVPEWKAEQTHEGCLCLISLGAACAKYATT